jgi:type IV secretory pathway VirB2 component (pilin)
MANIKGLPATLSLARRVGGAKKTFFLGFKKYFLILFLLIWLILPISALAVTATAGDGKATISFTGSPGATSYIVNSSPGNISNTGNGSPITVSGLTNGQKYTFTVSATNSAGNGVNSAKSNEVTPTATATSTTPDTSTQIKIQVPDTGPTGLQNIFDNIWNILFGFAGLVAVIFIIYGGYQYMTGGGGEGAEKAKKTILGAVIGLIIIIASVAIVNFVNSAMHGNLHLFSTNLSNTQSSSGSGATSSTSPAATPAGTDTSQIKAASTTDQAKINYCSNYEKQVSNCYSNALNTYNTYCQSKNSPANPAGIQTKKSVSQYLSQIFLGENAIAKTLAYLEDLPAAGQTACSNLYPMTTTMYNGLQAQAQTINGTQVNVTPAFYSCYTSNNNGNSTQADPKLYASFSSTCNNVQTQEKTITNGTTASGSSSSQTPAQTPSTTPNQQQQLTPYQSCVKNAQTKYNSCQNQLVQACYSQQSAYKSCLSDLVYYAFRLFNSHYCDKVQQSYNTCQSNWQQNCSNAQWRAQQICRLNYPTIY